MVASLNGPPHAEGCACQPCQVKRACLRKLMTLMAPEFAGALRAGGGLDASITTTIHPIGSS